MNNQWKDFADYISKYSANTNPEAAGKITSMFNMFNTVGAILRKGMVEIEDLYDSSTQTVVWFWEKYRPIVEEFRRRYNGQMYMRDFEYYADQMLKYVKILDSSYKVPETLLKYVPDK